MLDGHCRRAPAIEFAVRFACSVATVAYRRSRMRTVALGSSNGFVAGCEAADTRCDGTVEPADSSGLHGIFHCLAVGPWAHLLYADHGL